jgi:hypothetical protein
LLFDWSENVDSYSTCPAGPGTNFFRLIRDIPCNSFSLATNDSWVPKRDHDSVFCNIPSEFAKGSVHNYLGCIGVSNGIWDQFSQSKLDRGVRVIRLRQSLDFQNPGRHKVLRKTDLHCEDGEYRQNDVCTGAGEWRRVYNY